MGNSLWESQGVLNSHQFFCCFETGSYVVLAGILTSYVAEAGLELLNFLPSRC